MPSGTAGLSSDNMANNSFPNQSADSDTSVSLNGNFSGNSNEFTEHETPVTYYTLPQSQPLEEEHAVTYFTQPPSSTFDDNSGSIQSSQMNTEKEAPKLLSGERHVAQLLKAELEGNRVAAAEIERRGSCFLTSGGIGGLGMKGFEDVSEDEEYYGTRRINALPGTKDYRPLVGGFAAAAYEAAKAHHFKANERSSKNKEKDENLKMYRSNLPPPSI